MHNYANKIRNHEKRWVQMQDPGNALANKRNQLKYNTKYSHQTRRRENKRRRKEKRAAKTNPKQLIKWQ